MNWKQLREQEAEECLARQRAEYEAEEDFDMAQENDDADLLDSDR